MQSVAVPVQLSIWKMVGKAGLVCAVSGWLPSPAPVSPSACQPVDRSERGARDGEEGGEGEGRKGQDMEQDRARKDERWGEEKKRSR